RAIIETPVKKTSSGPSQNGSSEPKRGPAAESDDGRQVMHKIFTESRLISAGDFDAHWPKIDPAAEPKQPIEPFIQILAERQMVPVESSLKLLVEKSRLSFLPIERYDLDMDLARGFPRAICQRWCILPLDRMSKSILIATANPFNKQAALDV